MWIKVSSDSGFTGTGFDRPGSYFRLEDLAYLTVFGPSKDGLYHVAGHALPLGAFIAMDPGYPDLETAQKVLDKIVGSSEGVVSSEVAD